MKLMSDRPGILWQAIIVFLILLNCIFLFLVVISHLKPTTLENIALFDLIVSIILLTGYIIVFNKIKDRKAYLKKNWFLIIAFIPLYLLIPYTSLTDSLIFLKIFSLIKIISLYLFARDFAKEVIQYQEKTRLVYAVAIFLLVFFFCSFVFYTFEHGLNPKVVIYEDSIWFVLQTITTVGYGDIIPVTGMGRLMGVISMFSALALTSIITSVATFSLIEKFREGTEDLTQKTNERVKELNEKLDNLDRRLDDLDRSNDIQNLKNDINDLKLGIEGLKEFIKKNSK